jgi:CheY-like chemotaxis protein
MSGEDWTDAESARSVGEPDRPQDEGSAVRSPDRVAAMRGLMVVEDNEDAQFLIESEFSLDTRFSLVGVSNTAEDALEMARRTKPAIIVLDHSLAGAMTGLEAAPRLKELAPQAKIIFFTAHSELRHPVADEPAIDAFILKTEGLQLLRVIQQLLGTAGSAT